MKIRKILFAFLMVVTFLVTTLVAASAQETQPKLYVTAQVVDDIGISAEDVVTGAKKFFGNYGIEVVDNSGDGVKELFVTIGKDDADDDNDSIADSADNDDDGNTIADNQEKVEVVDLYDRLPCDMISAFPDQNTQEGVYVIISGADRSESIRFNAFVDTFAGATDAMADDTTFQFHLFYPAIAQGFIEVPKNERAMVKGLQKQLYGNGPVMSFPTTTIDYGKIQKGSDKVRRFSFTNTGNEPLIIKSAKGSCGCTVPTYPQEPIMPGETKTIDVSYDTNRPGPFRKQVTLTTNETPDTHTLTIQGEVMVPPVQESVPASTGGLKR